MSPSKQHLGLLLSTWRLKSAFSLQPRLAEMMVPDRLYQRSVLLAAGADESRSLCSLGLHKAGREASLSVNVQLQHFGKQSFP